MTQSLTVLAETPTCNSVLQKCDEALQARKKELNLCNLALTQNLSETGELSTKLSDSEDKLNSIWRNPFLLIGLGLVGGVLLVK